MVQKATEKERVINLDGPDGNAFVLLGMANSWGRQLSTESYADWVTTRMKEGDYAHLVAVFELEFGDIVTLETENDWLIEQIDEAKRKILENES